MSLEYFNYICSYDFENEKLNVWDPILKMYKCPCCRYPTLSSYADFDICKLCNWVCDGQNDSNADQILGGPNKDYSLTEARENFKKYKTMYRPLDSFFERETKGEMKIWKKKVIKWFKRTQHITLIENFNIAYRELQNKPGDEKWKVRF